MYPRWHIIVGLLVAELIFLVFPSIGVPGFLAIFFSSFLMDIDHYVYYIARKKSLCFSGSLKWFSDINEVSKRVPKKDRKHFYSGIYFLHGTEALVILIVLTFFNKLFFYVFLGFIVHQILDLVELIILKESPDKIISFFYSLYRTKYKKSYELVRK